MDTHVKLKHFSKKFNFLQYFIIIFFFAYINFSTAFWSKRDRYSKVRLPNVQFNSKQFNASLKVY